MDANKWLLQNKYKIIITSLPDMEEIGMNLKNWENWIIDTLYNIINSADDDAVIFFYQTNRKYKGKIIDKNYLISDVFLNNGFNKIFSKIVLKKEPNKIDLFRPTYTNLFAFSKKIKSGKATPDVIYSGKMIYKNAMGFNAVKSCIEFLNNKKIKDTVIDPFCGRGSVIHICNKLGFDSIGIDICKEQIKKAELL